MLRIIFMTVEAVITFTGQPAPIGRGELLLNHPTRLIHIGRTTVGIVAVGADEVQQTVVDHFQRQLARTARGESARVALKIKGLFKQPRVHTALLDGLIALHMSEDNAQILIILQGGQLVKDPVRPCDKGHFDQQQIGALYPELRDTLAVGDAGIIEDLGAEIDLGMIVCQNGKELVDRVLSAAQKSLGRLVGTVKMRGGNDGGNTLLARGTQHFHRHFGGLTAVVHFRQKVTVKIKHGIPPFLYYNRQSRENQLDFWRRV